MKKILILITVILFVSLTSFGQKLTLKDLITLCDKQNWEDINQTLLSKNWTYFASEKGDTYKYNTITWSYNKESYSNKAQGWFYLFTYEEYPNKISYSVFNKESYTLIQNSISSAGFKLLNSEIENNEIISTYTNANYTLKISSEKREISDYSWENESIIAYKITLIKKAGIYDTENGKKIDYYYDGTKEAEYTLLNGKLNGSLKSYHDNGQLKKIGNYLNGVENGLFKEYDENGNIVVEYNMLNDELNGAFKTYFTNGQILKSGSYLKGKENGLFIEFDEYGIKQVEYLMASGMKNGQCIEYYYNDETGKLELKQIGEYLNDEKNGLWTFVLIEDGNNERILTFEHYNKDVKNGLFQDIEENNLIIGTYKNDKLNGQYKVYLDVTRMLFGGRVISTDTSKLILIEDGYYYDGLKSGYWKNYDFTNTLRSEGRFSNDNKTGEWKYYYSNYTDKPYSGQLFSIQNYLNGELEGKSIRYSYLEEEKIPCSEIDDSKNPLDSCKKLVFLKVLETTFYKNDKMNGPFELRDSLNELIVKGFFKDDLKEGEWIHRYIEEDSNEKPYFIYQKGKYIKDNREGQWLEYFNEGSISKTFNYKNGQLHGEYISLNQFNKPSEKKQFQNGELTELIIFDSLGIKPKVKYEIYDVKYNSYKCRKTDFYKDGIISQEYWLKKDDEINHNFFDFTFYIATDEKFSDGTIGYKDGNFNVLNSENQPIITGKFLKEDRIGLWTYYYYDQKVKIESNYIQNNLATEKYYTLNGELFSGEFIYYDEENDIKEERKIKDGLRNGKTIYYDQNTKKSVKKENYKNGEIK